MDPIANFLNPVPQCGDTPVACGTFTRSISDGCGPLARLRFGLNDFNYQMVTESAFPTNLALLAHNLLVSSLNSEPDVTDFVIANGEPSSSSPKVGIKSGRIAANLKCTQATSEPCTFSVPSIITKTDPVGFLGRVADLLFFLASFVRLR